MAERLGLPSPTILPEFDELSFGKYEGKPVDDWLNSMYLNDLGEMFEQIEGDDAEARARETLSVLNGLPDGTLVVTNATLLHCMVGVSLTGRVMSLQELPSMENCFVTEYDESAESFSWDD